MTKVVDSSEYSANSIFVGCSVNEDGEPLVEVNGKAIGTVDGLLEFLGKYQGQQKAEVNVRWAAIGGYLGPKGYKVTAAVDDGRYRSASLLMDVPVEPVRKLIAVRDGVLCCDDIKIKSLSDLSKHLATVEIKDAQVDTLSVGSANIEGADKDVVARLQRELEDLKASLPRSVEEAIKSASIRNVRHHL